jgi:hypothetical protein
LQLEAYDEPVKLIVTSVVLPALHTGDCFTTTTKNENI